MSLTARSVFASKTGASPVPIFLSLSFLFVWSSPHLPLRREPRRARKGHQPMKFPVLSRRVAVAPLALALALAVVLAQQPKVPTTPAATSAAQGETTAPNVTIDTLFVADSYAIYGESRMVGQY